ncbi:manganese efflux pump MntP family protein [Azospirillum sp. B4]|uniref:manganese efflux pump MntP n=1 Tax=Azospirillum sp. B4 TaxID=95605 RepID=UPI000344B497|nr:manganese efflux pump MntP family protein [Azospirillum sp. B4]
MPITTSFALAFSLSMDAFAASLGKGASLNRPGMREAARVGAYFGLFELAAPILGWALGLSFARYIEAYDHWIAFGLLLVVGGRMSWLALRDDGKDKPKAERHSPLALAMTAIATSIDATAVGITLGYMNVDVPTTIALIGLVTFAMAFSGVMLGRAAGPVLGRWAEVVGGLGLIVIGAKVLYDHTLGGFGG